MSCLLISERIMRDGIAQAVRGGEGLWPPGTEPPAPESVGNGGPTPTMIPRRGMRRKDKKRIQGGKEKRGMIP